MEELESCHERNSFQRSDQARSRWQDVEMPKSWSPRRSNLLLNKSLMKTEINLTQITDEAVSAIVALSHRSNKYSYMGPGRFPRSRRSVGAIIAKVKATLDNAGFSIRDRHCAVSNIY